ncbi:MAG: RNA polymerase sigma factor [Thermoguttaceae bacterium]
MSDSHFQQQIQPLLAQSAAYAWAIVRSREDAEDAVQEAAIKAYRAFGGYDPAFPFRSWWLAILRNACRDLLRRRQSRPATVPIDRAALPPQAARPTDLDRDLHEALALLAETHREILQLRYFAGCSYQEMAHLLDIPAGTVMSRLHAARQALSELYRKDEHHATG